MKQITKTYTVYSFDELSEKAKQKVLTDLIYINVMGEWWEGVYEDAQNVGVTISEFDIDRGSYCKIKFPASSAYEVATKIMQDHGSVCDTYKTASIFVKEWDELVAHYSDGKNLDKVAEGNEDDFDEAADNLEVEFMGVLSYDYLKMLREEYEYLTSEEAIRETIEANDYQFLESGKQYF
jgi:hypothetical protein